MNKIGHNSAAYGEHILEETSPVLGDHHKKLFHYVQWQLADYIVGTENMTPEQEGVYMRFLVRLYDRGQAFQDDDKLMSLSMSLDIRRWRRIKSDLVRFGKIIIKNGCLTNARFERERVKRAAELRKQAENTRKYWEKKRSENTNSPEVHADFGRTSGELSEEVGDSHAKKSNDFNGIDKHPTSQSRVQSLEFRKERKIQSPDGLLSSDQPSLVAEDPVERRKLKATEAARMAMERYNEIAERCGLRKALKMTPTRQKRIVARIKEAGGWTEFEKALGHLEHSAFLQGKNDKGWMADFDFLCQAKSFSRLLDGGYGNSAHARTPDPMAKIYSGVL